MNSRTRFTSSTLGADFNAARWQNLGHGLILGRERKSSKGRYCDARWRKDHRTRLAGCGGRASHDNLGDGAAARRVCAASGGGIAKGPRVGDGTFSTFRTRWPRPAPGYGPRSRHSPRIRQRRRCKRIAEPNPRSRDNSIVCRGRQVLGWGRRYIDPANRARQLSRGTKSSLTLRWRELDSNVQFRAR